ncbi:MAG: Sec-independent protein translocase subunit TatA [Gordonia sp. (in: high G+C Gram-positive bacteria)]|uniref:Sec-independent protein translocase subunit TatA n=1 Tax=Gordonia sp. (in: high G+C Gram-positive bacteria) TaxID=84139 RepID=UPI0039E64366
MGALSPWHWAVVAIIVVVLFGAGKLPAAARSLGQSLRILKSEIGEMGKDGKDDGQRELPPGEQADTKAADSSSEKKSA